MLEGDGAWGGPTIARRAFAVAFDGDPVQEARTARFAAPSNGIRLTLGGASVSLALAREIPSNAASRRDEDTRASMCSISQFARACPPSTFASRSRTRSAAFLSS